MTVNLKQILQYLLAGEESRFGFTDYWNVIFLPSFSSAVRLWLAILKVLLCLGIAVSLSYLLAMM